MSKHVGYLNFGTSEVCLYQCKHFFPLRKSMATAIQLTRTNGNQSTAWLPQVLWRENAERLISQWRPSIILEAKLGHRHDIIRSVASLNLNSTAIYISLVLSISARLQHFSHPPIYKFLPPQQGQLLLHCRLCPGSRSLKQKLKTCHLHRCCEYEE